MKSRTANVFMYSRQKNVFIEEAILIHEKEFEKILKLFFACHAVYPINDAQDLYQELFS